MRVIGGVRIPEKDSYKVESTFDYDKFKFIDGNRDIDHVERLERSIRKVGLLVQPILVDEQMRIIEGQHRYTICKQLGLPVYYVVQDGIGLDEVKSLNSASKNWSVKNYIHSFAAGDKLVDYIYIEQLIKAYPWVTSRIITFATHGFAGGLKNNVREGNFKCSEAEYNRAIKALDYVNQFRKEIDGIGGRKEFYLIAIMFCFFCEEVDSDYLLTKFKKYYKSLTAITDIKSAILQIESKVYNYQMRSPREPISIVIEYERLRRANSSKKKNLLSEGT